MAIEFKTIEFENVWSKFKKQLSDILLDNPTLDKLGRVFLTDTVANKQKVDSQVAVTPSAVLDAVKEGFYTGDGSPRQVINELGFRPRFVIVYNINEGWNRAGKTTEFGSTMIVNTQYSTIIHKDSTINNDASELADEGFWVSSIGEQSTGKRIFLNEKGSRYFYIAYR